MQETLTQSQKEYIQRTREARKKREEERGCEINQDEVAEAIGVDRVTYTGYETRRPMPQKYIAKFCRFLGINERWLISDEGPMTYQFSGLKGEVMDRIATMNEDDIKRLAEISRLVKGPL